MKVNELMIGDWVNVYCEDWNEKFDNVIVIDYLSLCKCEPNYSLDVTKIDDMVKWFIELREKYKHL